MTCDLQTIDGVTRISGELSFATVGKITQRDISRHCEIVDLQALNFMDSAGLALLTNWKNQAQSESRNLRFINYPQTVADLANMADLSWVLE